ncbi:hypothetical protein RND81_01G042900 [Saponaria officinalis]|uniref:Copper transport protein n=1 Tax=Saponaria officinalis TaxID=3572 RepID=A0AAW1N5M4_SAPOF
MDHGHDMGGMNMTQSSSPSSTNTNMTMSHMNGMMMHMTFYWGHKAQILFSGWPGSSTGMYVLALFVVFLLAVMIEWVSRSRITKRNDVVSGVLLTLLHALRVGLAYLVMLALMSFNVGVFIVAVVGHAVGFLVFGTRVFGSGRGSDDEDEDRSLKLPPLSC